MAPASAELQHHASLMTQHINQHIENAGGWLAFDRYMHEALYAPGLGYYANDLQKFGEAGDFITAPELGSLFGCCLARQCAQVLSQTEGGDIVEFGAGSGALICTLLSELAQLKCLPRRYYVVELSASLKERQQALVQAQLGPLADRVIWLERLPSTPIQGVFIANEVLDAMPVKLFEAQSDQNVWELGVIKADSTGQYELAPKAMAGSLTKTVLERLDLPPHEQPYRSELGLQAEAWVASVAPMLECGALLIVDYGFNRSTYFHPDRSQGTLMCHYQHQANPDPLFMPGLQDITSHVDFTAIADSAQAADLDVAGYAPQAHFLLALGLLDLSLEPQDTAQQLMQAQEIKKLTMPHEMGELFKVLGLTKQLTQPLIGFSSLNHANRLWT